MAPATPGVADERTPVEATLATPGVADERMPVEAALVVPGVADGGTPVNEAGLPDAKTLDDPMLGTNKVGVGKLAGGNMEGEIVRLKISLGILPET